MEEQLQRFLALPDPVGIGLRLGEILPPSRSALKVCWYLLWLWL